MSHIKLHGVKPRIQYVANGTLTTYEFPFVIFSDTDIQIYLNDVLQSSEIYSVTGIKNTNGGSITFTTPPIAGTVITITRDLSIERTTDFQEGGALRADVLNGEFDYQTACLQQVADTINRSMILPPYATSTDVDLTLPSPSAGKAIVWNADGTNLENSAVKVNELESTLLSYKQNAENACNEAVLAAKLANEKADEATMQASEATTQAQIVTQKTQEVSNMLATKATIDMDNLTEVGKNNITNFCMPSDTYIDLVLNPSNSEYIAPADGYYTLSKKTTGFQFVSFHNKNNQMRTYSGMLENNAVRSFIPVAKGQTVLVEYNAGGAIEYFRFIYAKGCV